MKRSPSASGKPVYAAMVESVDESVGRVLATLNLPHYNEHLPSVPSSVIRRGSCRLIETFDPVGLELYNLADDLGETTNLAAVNPELVHDLRCELDAWRQDVGAEMMRPNPDYDSNVQLPTKKKRNKEEIRREHGSRL